MMNKVESMHQILNRVFIAILLVAVVPFVSAETSDIEKVGQVDLEQDDFLFEPEFQQRQLGEEDYRKDESGKKKYQLPQRRDETIGEKTSGNHKFSSTDIKKREDKGAYRYQSQKRQSSVNINKNRKLKQPSGVVGNTKIRKTRVDRNKELNKFKKDHSRLNKILRR